MGLRDKHKDRFTNQGFRPTNLSDTNINVMFNRCLASPTTLPSDVEKTFLFANFTDPNFVDTTIPISFDKSKLAENYKRIQYMFGQLEVVHKKNWLLTPDNSSKKYDGFNWNREDISLMQLYYLAIASELMMYFSPKGNFAPILDETAIPTLSPYDPNFPAWWEEHKSEWEG